MWYVKRVFFQGRNSGVVQIEHDFLIEIKDTDTGECRRGHYYEFDNLCIVGCFHTDELFYAGVVNPVSLKLIDCIKDVKIIRSIPKTAIRPSLDIIPLNDLYCKYSNFTYIEIKEVCIFITDIILDIFIKRDFTKEHFDVIKRKGCFYIDCFACGNKYKISVTDKFLPTITKLKILSREKGK